MRIRVLPITSGDEFPYIQVWRQSSSSSAVTYERVGQVRIQASQIISQENWRVADISLTNDNRLQFQSGDVIGFYHPPRFSHEIRTIRTSGYVLHEFTGFNDVSFALDGATNVLNNRQPLIQFEIGEEKILQHNIQIIDSTSFRHSV